MTTLLIVLASLVAAGFLYEAWARGRDRRIWSHPGRFVDVGGHQLHVRTYGEGDVVVVLESDEGAWSTHWGRLAEELGAVTRTIAYDRGGLGWSEPGPPPRDAETLARELHQLLAREAAGLPVVLVGHGTAAHVLRAYAHRYPFETAGLVFVDGFHDGLADRLRREQIPDAAPSPWVLRVAAILAALGVLRLFQRATSPNGHLPLPERQRALLDALELDPRVRRGAAEEMVAEQQSLDYLGRITETNDVPMRILTSTSTLAADEVPTDFPVDDYNRLWAEQSEEFLDLSKRAQRVLVEGSGHQLQLERPEIVLEAVMEVIEEARELRGRQDDDASRADAPRAAEKHA
ncbi:MAG: alpha/beta hydrolase [Planctomycetota bacterium]